MYKLPRKSVLNIPYYEYLPILSSSEMLAQAKCHSYTTVYTITFKAPKEN
jgi:hypothetical protein